VKEGKESKKKNERNGEGEKWRKQKEVQRKGKDFCFDCVMLPKLKIKTILDAIFTSTPIEVLVKT
jgi:hypothetical protein